MKIKEGDISIRGFIPNFQGEADNLFQVIGTGRKAETMVSSRYAVDAEGNFLPYELSTKVEIEILAGDKIGRQEFYNADAYRWEQKIFDLNETEINFHTAVTRAGKYRIEYVAEGTRRIWPEGRTYQFFVTVA